MAELRPLTYDAKFDHIVELLARRDSHAFDAPVANALLEALQPRSPDEAAAGAARLAALPAGATASYLRARWEMVRGTPDAAVASWNEFLAQVPCRDALVLLQAARAMAAAGDWSAAALRLRGALAERPDYTWHARAQAFVRQVIERAAGQRRVRVALIGSATLSLLVPVFRAVAFRDGLHVDCYEGLFGAYRQEILDPESGLHRFAPDLTFIIPSWRDLDLPSLGSASEEEARVEATVEEHLKLWGALAARSRTSIVQHAYDLPPVESAGNLAARRPGGRRRLVRRINMRLMDAAPTVVAVLDTERVVEEVGRAVWHDPALWHRARQHPSTRALPALAEEQMAHVRALTGLTRKVVVTDLDNTLWGGIIGEDGLSGIAVGEQSPEGEAHAALQTYLKELRARGILLAVASKNNPDEARLPFAEHQGMVLRLDDFAAFEANWDDKVTNLRRVAARLSLGTESFVFLDDNPFERAWVRSQMPEVAVVELGASPATYVRDLDAGRYFEVLTVSHEDLQRAELYRREHERDGLRAQAASIEEFLAGLRMQASAVPVSEQNLQRVTQLVNKTNQFNLTTRRYSEARVRGLASAPGAWTGVFELADRFGHHGIVGLLFCVSGESRQTWEIDTWLMSCRVLGRQLERFMLDRAVEAARQAGVSRLRGLYRPTPKNSIVADLFERLGFTSCGEIEDGRCYELTVAAATTPYSTFIEEVPPAGAAVADSSTAAGR